MKQGYQVFSVRYKSLRNKPDRRILKNLQPESTAVRTASINEIRQGLRAVLESKTFRQAPGLGRLLQYICSKALLQEPQQVTEYTIAVDVFGKTQDFKESKDSTVRVEVFRLRKRLAQFYEKEGADSRLRIVIPPGQYYPHFHLVEPGERSPAPNGGGTAGVVEDTLEGGMAEPALADLPAAPARWRLGRLFPAERERRIWIYATIAAGLIVAVVGIRAIHAGKTGVTKRVQPQSRAESGGLRPPLPSTAAPAPIRLIAGYSGQPHIDASGFVWSADRYFQGGRPWHSYEVSFARTNDPLLFQQWRGGDFSYHIPLQPGVYELHLYFVESRLPLDTGGGENLGTFSLDINGKRAASLDVDSDAMGPNIASERVFKDLQPASDGKLHLSFEGVNGIPFVNAIEVLPGIPHKQLPIRLVAQPRSFIDHAGQLWRPDNYYLNGRAIRRDVPAGGTPDPGLFAGERFGHFTYALPADVRGRYTLTLHFAELYFGPDAPGHGGLGSRVFNVTCNGVLLLEDFDIFREAGSLHALVKTFHHLKPTAQGKLNLTFEPVANYAVISAIEVLDESE